MKRPFPFRLVLRFAVASLLLVLMPLCQAQPSAVRLDKHSRKIERFLAACPGGSHIHLTLLDQSDEFGYLGSLSDQSFELLDPGTRIPQVFTYTQVDRVKCENLISSSGFHRNRHSMGVLIIVGIAAGVSVGIVAASRN